MITLHDGPSLRLTRYADKLVLDLKRKAKLTSDQVQDRVRMDYGGENTWTSDTSKVNEIVKAVEQLDSPRMQLLHSGKNLLLKLDGDTLILDIKNMGHLSRDGIALMEAKGMVNSGEDTWFGPAENQAEVLRLVKQIDRNWVSREAERLGVQQIRGGR